MHAVIIANIHKYKGKKFSQRIKRGLKDSMGSIKEHVIVLLSHWTSEPPLLVGIEIKRARHRDKFNGSNMASIKIFTVLLLTTIIGTVLARPGYGGYGGYIRHSTPISYTSYSYPSYSYPSYGYGHSLYSSYNYPSYGYGHGGHGLGGWLGDYW